MTVEMRISYTDQKDQHADMVKVFETKLSSKSFRTDATSWVNYLDYLKNQAAFSNTKATFAERQAYEEARKAIHVRAMASCDDTKLLISAA